jgi:N-methylhydantoinase B
MCAIAPEIPNNEGAFRPIRVKAPEGSILNCRRPAPVSARHLIGHFVSQPILKALSTPIPDQVIAGRLGGAVEHNVRGRVERWQRCVCLHLLFRGRHGCAAVPRWPVCHGVPERYHGVPAEVIESVAPIRMHKRELLTDTGGAGKFRGGLGQEMILEVLTGKPAIHSCMYDRTKFPADGYLGGLSGTAAK